MKTDPVHWSRAFFELHSCCDYVDNNMCASFNNAIIKSRFLPIISMLEAIRCRITVRIQENRSKAEKWLGNICPNIFKKLKINIKKSGFCQVMWNGKEGFEVNEKGKRRYTVNLDAWYCSCNYWMLSGLPCCHAISAIFKTSKKVEDYIDSMYSIEQCMRTYEHCLQPVEGEENWPLSSHPRPQAPGYVQCLVAQEKKGKEKLGRKQREVRCLGQEQ